MVLKNTVKLKAIFQSAKWNLVLFVKTGKNT